MKKYIITALMMLILYGNAVLYGVNDVLVLCLILITSGILFVSIRKLHAGNKKMMRVNAKPGGVLYKYLSDDRTIMLTLLAVFSSLLLSTVLVILIKGLVLQQGYLPIFITIIIASLILYSFLNSDVQSELVERNIHDDIATHGNELARIIYSAVLLNLILALAFSAYDTFEFRTSDVSFDNFTDRAVENSIERTDSNTYSRIFINAYLLMDNIKIAMAKMFVELFEIEDNFYGFYIVILFLNMLKLFAFSISFVILQRGFDGTANKLQPIVEKRGKQLVLLALAEGGIVYCNVSPRIKTWLRNRKDPAAGNEDKGISSSES